MFDQTCICLQNELSFDRDLPFDVKVYRMVGIQEPPGIKVQHVAITSGGWAPYLNENVPEVIEAFRLMHASQIIDVDGEAFRESCFFSEGRVAHFFGLPVIKGGDESKMLSEPNTAMISKEAAMRIYNSTDVLGKTFRNNDLPYTITGVFDNEGHKSHFEFDVLLSIVTVEYDSPWMHHLGNNSVITYVALPAQANAENIANIINEHFISVGRAHGDGTSGFMKNTFYLQDVADIYLRSAKIDIQTVSHSGNITSVYVFTLIAALVLAIACINFINLSTANATSRAREVGMRKVLVVFQFAISTALIMATLVVLHQVRHMQTKDRGYDPNNLMYVMFDGGVDYDQLNGFRQRLQSLPELQAICLASNYNGVAGKQSYVRVADSLNTTLMCRYGYVDPGFFPAMGIEIIEGRNFSFDAATDPYQAAIINEAAQKALGWDDPIGQRIANEYHEDYDHFTIVGVIRDYNYYNVRLPIQPAIYLFQKDRIAAINIRYAEGDPQAVRKLVEDEHSAFFPSQLFRAGFVEDILANQTRTEESTMKLFLWSSVLCIVISCLGLFGLTSYTMNRRRKEISIRRILGASVTRVNIMLLASFMRVVLLAVALALPVTYLIMNGWLNNYPYRISIGVGHMVASLLIIGSIALATVLIYSTRAARSKPADSLKYE